MEINVVIATKNRASDLLNCLQSLADQERLPGRIFVIDASDDDNTKLMIDRFVKKNNHLVQVEYEKACRPSLPAQRNQAIEMLVQGMVVFLDDDVILFPEYLKVMENFMGSQDWNTLGGVQVISQKQYNPKHFRSKLGILLDNTIFHIFHLSIPGNTQRVFMSGNFEYFDKPPTTVKRVEFLSGYNMCYPVDIFLQGHRFDESYGTLGGWAYLEDTDFSYRIWKLFGKCNYVLPNTYLEHNKSNLERLNYKNIYRMLVVNGYYFWKKNIRLSPISLMLFVWSNLGWFVLAIRLLISALDPRALWGVVSGWLYIIRLGGKFSSNNLHVV